MKKVLSFIIVCGLLTCAAVSCDNSANGSTISEDASPQEAAKEAVRQYTETTYNGDADKNIELSYPKSMIGPMSDSGTLDPLKETIKDINKTMKLKKLSVSDETELSEQALNGAATYFESMCSLLGIENTQFNITAGYTMKANRKIVNNGTTTKNTLQLSAVFIEDDGWKVLAMDEKKLEGFAESSNSSETTSDTTEK